jgi:hypothetical protein
MFPGAVREEGEKDMRFQSAFHVNIKRLDLPFFGPDGWYHAHKANSMRIADCVQRMREPLRPLNWSPTLGEMVTRLFSFTAFLRDATFNLQWEPHIAEEPAGD